MRHSEEITGAVPGRNLSVNFAVMFTGRDLQTCQPRRGVLGALVINGLIIKKVQADRQSREL